VSVKLRLLGLLGWLFFVSCFSFYQTAMAFRSSGFHDIGCCLLRCSPLPDWRSVDNSGQKRGFNFAAVIRFTGRDFFDSHSTIA